MKAGPRYSVTAEVSFCYGHRLPGHRGRCRFLHGHNARAEVTLASERLDRLGMVADFGRVKAELQAWADRELDHKLILDAGDPLVPALRRLGQPMKLLRGSPTAEALARLLFERARSRGLPVSAVRFWETPSSSASYHE